MNKLQRVGFSLIELMAVLILLGLISGVVVYSLQTPLQSAQKMDAVQRVISLDELVRQMSSQTHRAHEVIFHLNTSSFEVLNQDEESIMIKSLPRGWKFSLVETNGSKKAYDDVSIRYSDLGHTVTYLVQMQGSSQQISLLFYGLTGQTEEEPHDITVQEILR